MTTSDIKSELARRIDDLEKYNLVFELSNGIATVQCRGVGVIGYEVDVDTGAKTFEEVLNELTPKVVRLIKTCKSKSP